MLSMSIPGGKWEERVEVDITDDIDDSLLEKPSLVTYAAVTWPLKRQLIHFPNIFNLLLGQLVRPLIGGKRRYELCTCTL